MVGQNKLISAVDKYIETNTLPRTLMLEGDWGCGKHELARYIADSIKFPLHDITDSLTLETIERIMLSPTPSVYLINGSDISVKDQNVILKFLEEPLKNAYIILLTENKAKLLNTVVNRCVCLTFESYTNEELATFIENTSLWDTELVEYANTPGRVKEFESCPVKEMVEFAKKILLQIRLANYSNVLTIPNKINFKDKEELFDFELFSYLLVNVCGTLYRQQLIPFSAYELTNQFYNDTKIPHIGKQYLLEHYLIELKQLFERGA